MSMRKLPMGALEGSVDLDFKEVEENWNTYTLSDGTTLKVKLVLRGVKRLKNYEPDGSPIYVINTINVVRAVDIPPELKAKPKKSEMPPV
ncbi:MAG: hypothetical protein V3S09_05305 [Candidatus Bathyarchaeia archaeon]|nr:hypothetical protein [Candidatus Bathyarchaeota archaeon]